MALMFMAPYPSGGGGGSSNGLAIVDDSGGNTTISAVSVLPAGYRITKSAGGAGYNAAAISVSSISGADFILTIKRVSGTIVAGVSTTPSSTDNYDFPGVKFYMDGTTIAVYTFGSQVASNISADTFAWIRYDAAGDDFYFYRNNVNNYATATLVHVISNYGLGSIWFFDSSLNTTDAVVEVYMA